MPSLTLKEIRRRNRLGIPLFKTKRNPEVPTIDWINSIPKTIDENGCWIPIEWKPSDYRGYIRISINNKLIHLHRLSMCIHHNLDYLDYKIETRHGENCDKSCFNYEHLTPGSASDNERDKIHSNICPKCGSFCKTRNPIKYGINKGKITRF